MFTCPKCNTELADDARFCSHCGAPVPTFVFCTQCGTRNNADFSFCQKCGAALKASAAQESAPTAEVPEAMVNDSNSQAIEPQYATDTIPVNEAPQNTADAPINEAPLNTSDAPINEAPRNTSDAPVNEAPRNTPDAPAKENPLKKLSPKVLMFGGIGAVALIAIILLIIILSGSGKTRAIYLKDDELFTSKTSEDSNEQISTRLFPSTFSNHLSYRELGYVLGEMVAFDQNRTRVFFPDKIDDNSDGAAIYFNNMRSLDDEPTKVDSDILCYAIDKAGQKVAYIKGSGRNLYISDLEEKEKIAGNILCFYPNEDLTKIVFMNDENDFYIWTEDNDKEKIASSIYCVVKVSDDLKTVYYIKDEALYRQSTDDDDKEKLASDISTSFIKIYDSGEMYYIKNESEEKKLMDYITDDMASSDAYMTEPEYPVYPDYPEYPSWWDYATDEDYQKAVEQYENDCAEYDEICNQLYYDYEDAMNEYYQKLDRDSLRMDLNELTIDIPSYVLYYFDGKEEFVVSENLASTYIDMYSYSEPILIAEMRDSISMPNIKLSEIYSSYDAEERLYSALYTEAEEAVVIGSEVFSVDCDPTQSELSISPDGKAVYYLKDCENDCGDVYVRNIKNGKLEEPELFDSDISAYLPGFTPDGELMYFKNFDEYTGHGDLYIEKENVDYDVFCELYYFIGNDIVYLTDYDSNTRNATLKYYNGNEKSKIADDVYNVIVDNDTIFYINDYATYSNTGTLYCSDGGAPVKLDEDASILLNLSVDRVKAIDYDYKMYFYSN